MCTHYLRHKPYEVRVRHDGVHYAVYEQGTEALAVGGPAVM